MTIFNKVLDRLFKEAVSLGRPATDFAFRQEQMFNMNPKGWRMPKKAVRLDAQGLSRGDKKRIARDKAREKARNQIAESIAKRRDFTRHV